MLAAAPGRAPAARGLGRYASTSRTRAPRRPRARPRRADRATADRASGSPRSPARAAVAARARRQSASSASSDVLRSLASNGCVSSLSAIARSRTARAAARGTSAVSTARSAGLERAHLLGAGSRLRGTRTAIARSRARRSSWWSCRTPGIRRSRRVDPAAALPHELRDQPRLAHPGLRRDADDRPRPAIASSSFDERASSMVRPIIGSATGSTRRSGFTESVSAKAAPAPLALDLQRLELLQANSPRRRCERARRRRSLRTAPGSSAAPRG